MNPNLTFVLISSTNDVTIEKTLESIVGTAHILLIDGGPRKNISFDQHEISLSEIAKKFSCEYRKRDFTYAADQYNFGIRNVKTEWAFIIDSDETLSVDLRDFLNRGEFGSAIFYSVKRFNYFLGKKMRYGHFQPDWNIRLIRVGHCEYEAREVHARMVTNGTGRKAPGYMSHFTVQSIDSFFSKMLEFSKLEIESRNRENTSNERKARLRAILQKLPFQASLRFIYSYWVRLGFLDGRQGYLLAKSASFYEVLVQLHNLEKDG